METKNKRVVITPENPVKKAWSIHCHKTTIMGENLSYFLIEKEGKFRPFTIKEFTALMSKVKINTKDIDVRSYSGELPLGMLYINFWTMDQFMWVVPKGPREILYNDVKGKRRETIMELPSMVFYVNVNSLKIFFANDPVTMNSDYYQTPFFNTGPEGNVCMGSGNSTTLLDCDTIAQFTKRWENSFFKSPFTHPSGSTHMNHSTLYRLNMLNASQWEIWDYFVKEKMIKTEWLNKKGKLSDLV